MNCFQKMLIKMNTQRIYPIILIFLLFNILFIPVISDEIAIAGREVLKNNQDAVVTVKLVIQQRVSVGGRGADETELRSETTGIIIDSSGLTLISLTATDPSELLGNRISFDDADEMQFKFESDVTDIKIELADGTELPAEIVLRDKDFDMAFVRPVDKPAQSLTAVDITNSATPSILDNIIILNRLGRVANRVPSVSLNRIEAIIERPRLFYITSQNSGELGSPVFTTEGNFIGIILLRSIQTDTSSDIGSLLSSGLGGMGIIPIILPADDIKEAVKQVPPIEADELIE